MLEFSDYDVYVGYCVEDQTISYDYVEDGSFACDDEEDYTQDGENITIPLFEDGSMIRCHCSRMVQYRNDGTVDESLSVAQDMSYVEDGLMVKISCLYLKMEQRW